MIGSDFTVTVNGYSLGGALSVLFGFYASNDERFTQNGPVKIFSYGMPYAVSHTFADAFRHQEVSRKLQHARFYNSNDIGEFLCYICSIVVFSFYSLLLLCLFTILINPSCTPALQCQANKERE